MTRYLKCEVISLFSKFGQIKPFDKFCHKAGAEWDTYVARSDILLMASQNQRPLKRPFLAPVSTQGLDRPEGKHRVQCTQIQKDILQAWGLPVSP